MPPANAPIRLLLIADSTDTCERIASALLSAPAYYRVERVTSAEFAQSDVANDVQVALVDQVLRAGRAAQAVQRLNAAGVPAVVLVDSRDVQQVQEVVLAGAAALVAAPFEDGQLWDSVATALAKGVRPAASSVPRPAESSMTTGQGLVVALYGPKGGSGVSVIAANLALAIQERSRKGAALMEVGESGSSIATLLNLRPRRTLGDLMARFAASDHELLQDVMTPHSGGLKVLLAPPGPNNSHMPMDFLSDVVDALQRTYDYVLVDLSSCAPTTVLPMMRLGNATLLVIVPEMTGLQQARQFLDLMTVNIPDIKPNLVLNRADMPGAVPADAIRRHLKMEIAAMLPDDQSLVSYSVNRGVPFMMSDPRSSLSKAIARLAQDLAPAGAGAPAGEGKAGSGIAGLAGRLVGRGRT